MRPAVGISVVLALFAFLVPRASAAAPLTYGQLNPKRYMKVVPVPKSANVVASVTCPKGTTLMTGGAFLSAASVDPNGPNPSLADTSYLTSSFPTSRGWRASAFNQDIVGATDLLLSVNAWCTKRAISIRTIREDGRLQNGVAEVSHACPGQTQALAGGGFWHAPGSSKIRDTLWEPLIATTASENGHAWFAAGADNEPSLFVFTLVMRCTASFTNNGVTATSDAVATGADGGGYTLACGGEHVISGGAAWTTPSGDAFVAAPNLRLNSSSLTDDAVGWYAAGYNGSGSTYHILWLGYCLG